MMGYTRGMKIVAAAIVALALLCVAASRAHAMDLTLINRSTVPAAQIDRAERAVVYQVNHQLRLYWHVPHIAFVPSGGIPIYLLSGNGIMGGGGAHFAPGPTIFGRFATPSAFAATGTARRRFTVAGTGGARVSWTVALSHEVLEMIVNPRTKRRAPHRIHHLRVWVEVGDPVEARVYWVDGVQVSDFVTPRWFGFARFASFMPYDYLGRVDASYQLAPGGYMPGDPTDKARNNL